jgi:hypothetical protein
MAPERVCRHGRNDRHRAGVSSKRAPATIPASFSSKAARPEPQALVWFQQLDAIAERIVNVDTVIALERLILLQRIT